MSLRFRSALVVLTSAAALLVPGSASAADWCTTATPNKDFVGGGATNAWSDPENWLPAGVPTSGQTVCVRTDASIDVAPAAAAITFEVSSSVVSFHGFGTATDVTVLDSAEISSVASLSIPAGQVITNQGTWTTGDTDLTGSGLFVNDTGAEFLRTNSANGLWYQTVKFDNHGLYRFTGNTYGVTQFNGDGNHTGGRFEVGGAVTNPRIQFAGGTHVLTGTTLARTSGATAGGYDNSSTLDLRGGGLVQDAALANTGTWLTDDTPPFSNSSAIKTITWSSGTLSGSEFVVPVSWTFAQGGSMNVPSTQTITNQGTWTTTDTDLTGSGLFINDTGAEFLRTNTANGLYYQTVKFDNHGLYRFTGNTYGITQFTSDGNHTGGRFEVGGAVTNPRIQFAGGTHVLAGTTLARTTGATAGGFDNSAILDLQGGNVVLNAPLVNTGTWLTDDTPPFSNSSAIKTITWSSGTLSGTEFVVPAGWTFEQTGSISIPSTQTITNQGTWTTTDTDLTGSGLFINDTGAEFLRTNTANGLYYQTVKFDNHGLYRFTGNTYGITQFTSDGNHTGGRFEVGGAVTNPRIQFAGGTHVLAGTTLARTTGATAGGFDNSAILDLQGGNVVLNAPLVNTGTWLTDDTPPFSNSSAIKTITWSSGTLSGTEFVVPAGWTFEQTGSISIPSTQTITNQGTWTTTDTDLTGSGLFINDTGAEFLRTNTANGLYYQTVKFDNHGLYRFTGNTYGITQFTSDGNHTGGRFEVGGESVDPRIEFSGGVHELTNATLARSPGATAGRYVDGANIIVDDNATITSAAPFAPDDQLASGAFTVGGTGLVVTGNVLAGAGVVSVPFGSSVRVSSGAASIGSRTMAMAGALQLDAGANIDGTTSTIALTGELARSAPAGIADAVVGSGVNLTTVSSADIDVLAGRLRIDGTLNGQSNRLGAGTWFVAADASVRLATSVTGVDGSLVLDGASATIADAPTIAVVTGSVDVRNGAELRLASGADIEGHVSAGTNGTLTLPNVRIRANGLVDGPGTLELTVMPDVYESGTLDLSTGTRLLANLRSDGTVLVGTRDIAVTGSVELLPNSVLDVALDPTGGGSLAAGSTFKVDGVLDLDTTALTASPAYTYAHEFARAGTTRSGSFDAIVPAVALTAPRAFKLVIAGPALSLEVTETELPNAIGDAITASPTPGGPAVTGDIELTWPAATDTGSGIFGYSVQLDSGLFTFQPGTTANFAGLAPGAHEVRVRAVDLEGNQGPVRTFGPFVLTTAPSVGTLATSSPVVSTETVSDAVSLSWSAGPATGISLAGYRASISTSNSATPTGPAAAATTATFSSLAPGMYWVAVQAVDTAGNAGAVSQFGPFVLKAAPVVDPPVVVPPVVVPPVVVPPVVEPPKDTTPPKVGPVPTPTITPSGVVTFKVRGCPEGEISCKGSIKAETRIAPGLLKAKAKKPKLVNFVLGTVKFTAKGGQTSTVKLTLSKKAKAILKKAKVLKVTTTITVTDAAGNKTVVKKTLTIRAPKKLR